MSKHRKKKSHLLKIKSSRKRFRQVIEKCIVVASKAPAGTRMKALGQCVKRTLR